MEYFEILSALALFAEHYIPTLIVAGVIYLALHILQGVGLYSLAKRAERRFAWMAFVPFFNAYLLGKLAGNCTFFGAKMKNAGLWLAISEFFTCVGYAFYEFTSCTLSPYYQAYDNFTYDYVGYPESLNWVYTTDTVLGYVLPILRLLYIVFLVTVLFSFFRKYAMRHSVAFSLFSVLFPVKGAFIFAVRNNEAIDYERYMRAQREAYYRTQQQYYNRNPYERPPYGNQKNPYNNPYNNNGNSSYNNPPSPDPFEEFNDNKKSNSDNDEFFK